MAFYTDTLNTQSSLIARATDWFTATKSAIANYKTYRTTLNELNAMSARELDDIGINASMIQSVAREAAFGK